MSDFMRKERQEGCGGNGLRAGSVTRSSVATCCRRHRAPAIPTPRGLGANLLPAAQCIQPSSDPS